MIVKVDICPVVRHLAAPTRAVVSREQPKDYDNSLAQCLEVIALLCHPQHAASAGGPRPRPAHGSTSNVPRILCK